MMNCIYRAVGTRGAGGAMAPPVFSEEHKRGTYMTTFIISGSGKYEQISGIPCYGNLVTTLQYVA